MTGIRTPNQSTRGPAFPQGAPQVHFSDGPKLVGKTVTLTSGALVAGIATPGALLTPNLPQATLTDTAGPMVGRQTQFTTQGQILSYKGEAAHYVVSTQGIIQQPGLDPGLTFPLACYVVNWTIGGTNFETRLDGNSDQFLGIVAEQITVTGRWDEENGVTIMGTPLYYPAAMNLAASLALAQGLPSTAFRSRLLPYNDEGLGLLIDIEIPYAAKGYIVRRGLASNWFGDTFFSVTPSGPNVDRYSPAEVAAAHGRGEHLSVPSVADFLTQFPDGASGPAGLGLVEFLMRM